MDLYRPSKNLRLISIDYASLRKKIMETEECTLDSLGDPSRWTSLPLSALFCQLQQDRFRLNPNENSRFMGRQIFADFYQAGTNFPWRTGTTYFLHILLALARLVKESRRVGRAAGAGRSGGFFFV